MFVDKTLLLKGVAGVAALGGVVGGSFAVQKAGLFSPSSNAGDAQPKADVQGAGQGGNAATNSLTTESTEDDYGIPKRCNKSSSSSCDLTEEELKKIKFEVLGDTGDVKVENFPSGEGQKLTLTIDSTDTNKKKYIFSNGSTSAVTLKKGDETSPKTLTLGAGKTKFTLDTSNKRLKQFTLGDYGLPSDCSESCSLTSTDLEDIKFKDLDEGSGDITVTPSTGTVSLEIKDVGGTNRYIFTNSGQEVSISKGTANKVTLTSNKKTQFTDSDSKLNKVVLDNYGIPTSCSSSCTLTADDLGEIKFEELGGGTGTVSTTDKTVTLTVDSTNKRYTFNNSSDSPITIQKDASKKVTLSKGNNRFKGVSDNRLKKIVVDNKGLPSDCGNSCTLTEDDLKEIKFRAYDGGTGTVTLEPATPNPQITLSITTAAGSPNTKIYTFNNKGSKVTLKKGNDKTVALETGETEFTDKDNKLVPYEDPDLKKVNDKLGILKLPEKCKFNKNEKNKNSKECNVTEEELKKIEFLNKEKGAESRIEGSVNGLKLTINRLSSEEGERKYRNGVDLEFIFSGYSGEIKIKDNRTDSGTATSDIILARNTNTPFTITDTTAGSGNENRLTKHFASGNIADKLGLSCSGNSPNINCTPWDTEHKIKFLNSAGNDIEEITVESNNKDTQILTATENTANYELGIKFTGKANFPSTNSKIQASSCYEAKYVPGANKGWGLFKKSNC